MCAFYIEKVVLFTYSRLNPSNFNKAEEGEYPRCQLFQMAATIMEAAIMETGCRTILVAAIFPQKIMTFRGPFKGGNR